MNAKDTIDLPNIKTSKADERAFARQELVYNVTEDILVILEDLDISKKELARRLGKSKSYVSQVLSGARNMTLGSLADICYALDITPEIKMPQKFSESHDVYTSKNEWKDQQMEIWDSNLIEKCKNVIDCTEPQIWVTSEAA